MVKGTARGEITKPSIRLAMDQSAGGKRVTPKSIMKSIVVEVPYRGACYTFIVTGTTCSVSAMLPHAGQTRRVETVPSEVACAALRELQAKLAAVPDSRR